jgi:hypothetical protein
MSFIASLGILTPIRVSSRLYLKERLLLHGDNVRLPRACLQEFADDAVETAKAIAQLMRHGWREMVTQHLDAKANAIGSILNPLPPDERGYPPNEDTRNRVKSVLRKHGIPFTE